MFSLWQNNEYNFKEQVTIHFLKTIQVETFRQSCPLGSTLHKTYWPTLPFFITDYIKLFFQFFAQVFSKSSRCSVFLFSVNGTKHWARPKHSEHVFLRRAQLSWGNPFRSLLKGTHLRGPTELVTELKVIFSWRARSSVSRSTWIYKSRAFKGTVYQHIYQNVESLPNTVATKLKHSQNRWKRSMDQDPVRSGTFWAFRTFWVGTKFD